MYLFIQSCSRGALEKWKQNLGCQATYQKLIEVFESAGYQGYAEFVRNINFDECLRKLKLLILCICMSHSLAGFLDHYHCI